MKTIDPPDRNTFQLPDDPGAQPGNDQAADLIRSKLDRLYTREPDVVTEAIESARERTAAEFAAEANFEFSLAAPLNGDVTAWRPELWRDDSLTASDILQLELEEGRLGPRAIAEQIINRIENDTETEEDRYRLNLERLRANDREVDKDMGYAPEPVHS